MSTYNVNPVGTLQELCMKKKWHLPTYYDRPRSVNSNGSPCFTCECRLGTIRVFGHGQNKKNAKFYAASKMLDRISSGSSTEYPHAAIDPKTAAIGFHSEANTKFLQQNPYQPPTLRAIEAAPTGDEDELNSAVKQMSINNDRSAVDTTDYVKKLTEVCQAEGIVMDLQSCAQKSKDNYCQFYLELDVYPNVYFHALGATTEAAQNKVCQAALSYWETFADQGRFLGEVEAAEAVEEKNE